MDSLTDISSATLTATVTENVTATANQINVLSDSSNNSNIDPVKLCEHCHKYYDTIKMAWTNDKLLCHHCQPNNL
jgi:formylmethanofuran dehydrogenase subunit E